MQLDKTAIAIRERGSLELLDLSLHVTRRYLPQLTLLTLVGAAPFFLLNRWALNGYAALDARNFTPSDFSSRILVYVMTLSILTMIQLPLATALTTTFLGRAVFLEQPKLRGLIRETRGVWWHLLWCQGLLRLILPCCLLAAAALPWEDFDRPGITVILTLAAIYTCLVRGVRPYLNEIILLEKNPLRTQPGMLSTGKRNELLHRASGGQLFSMFIGSALICAILTSMLFLSGQFVRAVFLNTTVVGPGMLFYYLPLIMWLVGGFITVHRYLAYLDLRIRQEGWAIELRLRAEAAKVRSDLSLGLK